MVLGGALEGGISLKRRRRSFLDFSFGKTKYVLASEDVASEIPIHRARLIRRAPSAPGGQEIKGYTKIICFYRNS